MVVAHFGVTPIAVLMPALYLAPRFGKVAVTMGMHNVVWSEHTGQGALNDRVLENLLHFGDARQNIIARIAFLGHHGANVFTHAGMKFW